ncbi:MAG: ABC transporter ATP-binding protein [Candidatus Woesearchaeota archaeon]
MEEKRYIEIDNLIKRFGKKLVLDRVNLKIKLGSFFGIIGLSGCGKTTLLNIIIGFWKPTIGRLTYDGHNIFKNQHHFKQKLGFATQAGSVYSNLTVNENLRYFGRMYNMRKDDILRRTEILLDLIDLTGANKVLAKDLSTGMQRRLDIACAMIHNPEILILDEPTEDLDPVLRKELLALLTKINENGTTIIMTSHLLSDLETVCDKIAILHNGYILEVGAPIELKEKYSKTEEIHIISTPGKYESMVKGLPKNLVSKIIIKKGKKAIIYTSSGSKVVGELLKLTQSHKEKVIELSLHKPSMEEIFEAITKR